MASIRLFGAFPCPSPSLAILVLAAIAATVQTVAAPAYGQADVGPQESAALTGAYDGPEFLAGRDVQVSAEIADDLFAAGEYVSVDDATVEDVYAAGRVLRFRAIQAESLVGAADTLRVSGILGDDVIAAGRSVEIEPGTRIGGNAILAGSDVDVSATVTGALVVGAQRVVVEGEIGGDARLIAGQIVLRPGTTIAGDLVRPADADVVGLDGAAIEGNIVTVAMPEGMGRVPFVGGLLVGMAIAVGFLVAAVALVALVPGLFMDAAAAIALHPGRSLLLGIGVLIGGPALAGILFATVVGAPLGLVAVFALGIIVIAAPVASALWLGSFVTRARRRDAGAPPPRRPLLAVAIGVVLLSVALAIPWVGVLAGMAALTAGLGGLAAPVWRRLRPSRIPAGSA